MNKNLFFQRWNEPSLGWDPTKFGGILACEWPLSDRQIWTPDLEWSQRCSNTRAIMNSTSTYTIYCL